jgi:hypothetical protein
MTIISTASPVIAALPAGRYRVAKQLSDGRMGRVQMIAGARTLIDLPVRELDGLDHIVAHKGGSIALWTTPHIFGRKAPAVTLDLTKEEN